VPEPLPELSAPPVEPVLAPAEEPPLLPLPKVELLPLVDGLELDIPLLELLGDELLLVELPWRARQSVFCVPVRRSQSEFWLSVPVLLPVLEPLPMLELPVLEPLPVLEEPLPMLDPLPMLELPLPMLLPVDPLLPELLPWAPAPCASVNPIAAAPSAAARVFNFMCAPCERDRNAGDAKAPRRLG
jgi:hypothetical protein